MLYITNYYINYKLILNSLKLLLKMSMLKNVLSDTYKLFSLGNLRT